jgi:hypothetical protein
MLTNSNSGIYSPNIFGILDVFNSCISWWISLFFQLLIVQTLENCSCSLEGLLPLCKKCEKLKTCHEILLRKSFQDIIFTLILFLRFVFSLL